MGTRFLGLERFEAFAPPEEDDLPLSRHISARLEHVMAEQHLANGTEVTLPSLMSLARFFHTGHLEVYDALQHLHNRGFDYQLHGLDDPIRVWQSHTSYDDPTP